MISSGLPSPTGVGRKIVLRNCHPDTVHALLRLVDEANASKTPDYRFDGLTENSPLSYRDVLAVFELFEKYGGRPVARTMLFDLVRAYGSELTEAALAKSSRAWIRLVGRKMMCVHTQAIVLRRFAFQQEMNAEKEKYKRKLKPRSKTKAKNKDEPAQQGGGCNCGRAAA